jgi:ATP-dependent DNA helicase RecG
MSENPLALAIKNIPGVSAKSADALTSIGLITVFDILLRVPKLIVEEEEAPGLAFLEAGRVYVVRVVVHAVKISGSVFKKRLEAIVQDDTGRMSVVFFGPAVNYAQNLLKTGAEVTLIGEAKDFIGRIQMVHPKVKTTQETPVSALKQATYSQIAGLNSRIFKNIITKALNLLTNHSLEHLDTNFLSEHKLKDLKTALLAIHKPEKQDAPSWDARATDPQFNRLAFEELLSFYVRLFRERQADKKLKSCGLPRRELQELCEHSSLPFKLTNAQERVVREILHDMSYDKPMKRLIQGDVGSGKTAVSALAALHAVMSGYQVAVMAPTEILAEQLFSTYKLFFANQNISTAYLSSVTKSKAKKLILSQLESGEITIIIGTHALLNDTIIFKNLGLSIIDEQHRFGVKQRAALLHSCEERQGFSPHLLVMSATPIPRTLALTVYGDLDLSVIDEGPPGRQPIISKILSGPPLKSLERLGQRIIASNQKAFIIFPLVEESEHMDLENATKAASFLKERFGSHQCLLLHGRMKPEEKHSVMEQFRHEPIAFLVSTTVVEVGVDIPNATCMVITHPERFGLAQLHQLRGRVGRGSLASFCFLLTDLQNKFGTAYKRLSALCNTQDGFELAQVDLDLRGPGELLGTKQAGLPNFLIFNHSDFGHLVEPAKNYAKYLTHTDLPNNTQHLYINKEAYFS